jgi:hypothetical protein
MKVSNLDYYFTFEEIIINYYISISDIECDLMDVNMSDGFVKQMLDGTNGQGVHLLIADNVSKQRFIILDS